MDFFREPTLSLRTEAYGKPTEALRLRGRWGSVGGFVSCRLLSCDFLSVEIPVFLCILHPVLSVPSAWWTFLPRKAQASVCHTLLWRLWGRLAWHCPSQGKEIKAEKNRVLDATTSTFSCVCLRVFVLLSFLSGSGDFCSLSASLSPDISTHF